MGCLGLEFCCACHLLVSMPVMSKHVPETYLIALRLCTVLSMAEPQYTQVMCL